MTNKILIGVVVTALAVVAGIFFVWKTLPTASAPVSAPLAPQEMATSTYATTTFSVVYPQDFTVNDSYVYDQVNPKKPIHGVKFVIPVAMATGTNLSSLDTGVSIEQLPRAKNCTGDIYLAANVKPTTVNENGIAYSLATSSGVASGKMYDEMVYALSGSSPCTAVRYSIHTNNTSNSLPGVIQEYNRDGLLVAFDKIRQSLKLDAVPVAPAPAPVPAPTTP